MTHVCSLFFVKYLDITIHASILHAALKCVQRVHRDPLFYQTIYTELECVPACVGYLAHLMKQTNLDINIMHTVLDSIHKQQEICFVFSHVY